MPPPAAIAAARVLAAAPVRAALRRETVTFTTEDNLVIGAVYAVLRRPGPLEQGVGEGLGLQALHEVGGGRVDVGGDRHVAYRPLKRAGAD